jgi:hypothetical protein
MSVPPVTPGASARRFRITLFRVMAVQVITLVILWILQQRFSA